MSGTTGSGARRWWALAALALSVLVVGLDLFVLTLALPTMSVDLHASSSDLQWFVAAYSLVLAAALLPAGLAGDRLGRRRLLTWALALFGAASLACAYAGSAGELIAARAVLGIAAAVIMPMSLAVIPVLFTAAERPRAISIMGGATFIGFPIGPVLGGWLLDHFWWGSVFLINVPVVVIAVIAVRWLMPESRAQRKPRIDLPGALVSSAGLAALTYGLIEAGQDGWASPAAIGGIAGGVAVLIAFVMGEAWLRRRGGEPLVDLALFGSAGFGWGTGLATMVQFALFGISFAMPQYFLSVRGLDSLGSGVRQLPLIGGLMVGLIAGQRLAGARPRAFANNNFAKARGAADHGDRPLLSLKLLVGGGLAVMAIALAVGTRTGVASGTGYVSAWFAVTGLGLGLALPNTMNAALGALTAERSGSGSALMTAMRQVGATIGVAVLGTVLSSVYQGRLHLAGLPAAAAAAARSSVTGGLAVARATGSAALEHQVRMAYAGGLDVMLWVCAGIAAVAAVLAVAFLPRQAGSAAQQGPAETVPADPGIEQPVGAE